VHILENCKQQYGKAGWGGGYYKTQVQKEQQ